MRIPIKHALALVERIPFVGELNEASLVSQSYDSKGKNC